MITVHVCINNDEIFCVKAVRIAGEEGGACEYKVAYRQKGKWMNRKEKLEWHHCKGVLDLAMAQGFGNGRLSFKAINPEYLLKFEE